MALSFTQLSTYRSCPRQYEYCYVKKVPRGISEAEAFGAAVHNALKKWGELEIAQREDDTAISDKRLAASRQLPLFVEELRATREPLSATRLVALWHSCCPTNAYKLRVEADAARMRGEELMRQYFEWWSAEKREVVAVERGFSVDVFSEQRLAMSDERLAADATRYSLPAMRYTISGRFDRIERTSQGLHVIDFKTSRPKTQVEADADLQLSIYALACQDAFGELPALLSFLHLTEEGVIEISTTRNESQIRDALKQITSFQVRIDDSDFTPTPSVTTCKRCPYRGVCDVAAV